MGLEVGSVSMTTKGESLMSSYLLLALQAHSSEDFSVGAYELWFYKSGGCPTLGGHD